MLHDDFFHHSFLKFCVELAVCIILARPRQIILIFSPLVTEHLVRPFLQGLIEVCPCCSLRWWPRWPTGGPPRNHFFFWDLLLLHRISLSLCVTVTVIFATGGALGAVAPSPNELISISEPGCGISRVLCKE